MMTIFLLLQMMWKLIVGILIKSCRAMKIQVCANPTFSYFTYVLTIILYFVCPFPMLAIGAVNDVQLPDTASGLGTQPGKYFLLHGS